MLAIILCDNNKKNNEIYNKRIRDLAKLQNIEIDIKVFTSGKQMLFFLEEISYQADLIYLNTTFNDMSGIEVAKKIREFNESVQIVFLTDDDKYIYEAFEISATNYLIKSQITDERLMKTLIVAVESINEKKQRYFICDDGSKKIIVPIRKIEYFEIFKRVIFIHYGEKKTFKFYGKMNILEDTMNCNGFIRVHRSYLINSAHIKNFSSQVIRLESGMVLPLGNTYSKNLKTIFDGCILSNVME